MKELVPVAMLLIGRRRPREHPKGHFQSKDHTRGILCNNRLRMRTPLPFPFEWPSVTTEVTFHNVSSGQKASLGRILRMRTPFHWADIAQLLVAHAHIQENFEGFTWPSVISGSPGTCTTAMVRKNAEGKPGMRRAYLRSLPVRATSVHVTSGHVTAVLIYYFSPYYIELSSYYIELNSYYIELSPYHIELSSYYIELSPY